MRHIIKKLNLIEQKLERRYNLMFQVEDEILKLEKKRSKVQMQIVRLESDIGTLAKKASEYIHTHS